MASYEPFVKNSYWKLLENPSRVFKWFVLVFLRTVTSFCDLHVQDQCCLFFIITDLILHLLFSFIIILWFDWVKIYLPTCNFLDPLKTLSEKLGTYWLLFTVFHSSGANSILSGWYNSSAVLYLRFTRLFCVLSFHHFLMSPSLNTTV